MKIRVLTLETLLALAKGDTHAYEIYRRVIEDSESTLVIRDWGVYRELTRLEQEGLAETNSVKDKQIYHLTLKGRKLLTYESHRIARLNRLLLERLG